ncbi:MAG: hypothetical protein JO069_08485 [Verrucomicrobia bacterium]|nr:hypothetical protein [Verrucomicrobiota bacterium]
MSGELMGTDFAIRYARLSRDLTPEPCSRQQWLDWVNDPNHPDALVQERLDDWEARVEFTGIGTGRGKPKFTVLVDHPQYAGGRWEFDTFEEARNAVGRALDQCRELEMELAEADGPRSTSFLSSSPSQSPLGLRPAADGPKRTFFLFWQG